MQNTNSRDLFAEQSLHHFLRYPLEFEVGVLIISGVVGLGTGIADRIIPSGQTRVVRLSLPAQQGCWYEARAT